PLATHSFPTRRSSDLYMEIRALEPVTIVGARSAAAGSVELHRMQMQGNTMKMAPVERLQLKAKQTLSLSPRGDRLSVCFAFNCSRSTGAIFMVLPCICMRCSSTLPAAALRAPTIVTGSSARISIYRSEERRVGKECVASG